MERWWRKLMQGFMWLLMFIVGILFTAAFVDALQEDEKNPVILIGRLSGAIAVTSMAVAYLLHRHKQRWMAFPLAVLCFACCQLVLLALLFVLLHLPWMWATHGQYKGGAQVPAVGIFIIILFIWGYFVGPKLYRRTFWPYLNGIPAKAKLTQILEGSTGYLILKMLDYDFHYVYTDANGKEHEGFLKSIAVPRLDRMKVGDEIEILYDPKHPEYSVWPMG